MKRTKRESQGILVHAVFYAFLLIGLIYFSYGVVYPGVIEIEQKKKDTAILAQDIQAITKGGISYTDFLALGKAVTTGTGYSSYDVELLKDIKEDFFAQHLKNTTNEGFMVFLEKKSEEINNDENKLKMQEKEEEIVQLLPSYSEVTNDLTAEALTDFKFINYVETILESFSLKYTDPIGIKDIVLLEDFSNDGKNNKGLETNIFYIPLGLNLNGSKENIINFLHFIEKAGNIEVKDNLLSVYRDNFLIKRGRKITLLGSGKDADYNIYENQMIDLDSFQMREYINSSGYTGESSKKTFPDFIKSTQGGEKIKIDVELKFYIKGLPYYKVEEFVVNMLSQYAALEKNVNILMKNKKIKGIDKINVNKINAYLKEISSDIKQIAQGLKKKDNIDKLYKKAVKYNVILDTLEEKIIIK
ncbi:hypothetical protein A9Q91_06110 [Candidatus Gracilibacteria bacterium 28_42_T64]|nr:hypothetical protein A9Q91_06110 [Candidatus Gracilibacteria bacterium 28_42_T64]